MDPISFAVTVLAIYGILQRTPSLVGEAVREWEYARRGEESPAALERRKRLEAAGIDPAAGGAFRQYAGNVWRDYWLDRDTERAARRAKQSVADADQAAQSWWDRLHDRIDEETRTRLDQWRHPAAPATTGPSKPTADATRPDAASRQDQPPAGNTTPNPDPDEWMDPRYDQPVDGEEPITVVHDDTTYTDGRRRPDDDPESEPEPGPIRVNVTVGNPIRPEQPGRQREAVAALTAGGTTMTVVAQQAVTGVQSGAAEARAIQRSIEAATAEYVNQLAKIRARIYALGEQTVGTVQLAAHSRVVAHTASAAEAAAAAQAAAKGCSSEVSPLLGLVAREFDRISS